MICKKFLLTSLLIFSLIGNCFAYIFSDDFTGATIDTAKWTETDPGGIISQNGNIILTLAHSGTINRFDNNLTSVSSISSGVAVAQGNLTWTTDSSQEAEGGIHLWKDNNNFAVIESRTAASGVLRLRIFSAGVSVYSLNTTVVKGQDVKIWTDGTDIKFYYWNVDTWTQLGTTQTFSLDYPLKYIITAEDDASYTGANPINIDDAYFSNTEYTTQYPNGEITPSGQIIWIN